MKTDRSVWRLERNDCDLELYKEGNMCRDDVKVELMDYIH